MTLATSRPRGEAPGSTPQYLHVYEVKLLNTGHIWDSDDVPYSEMSPIWRYGMGQNEVPFVEGAFSEVLLHVCITVVGLLKLLCSRDLRKYCSWPSTRALVRLLLDSLKLMCLVTSLGAGAASLSTDRCPMSAAAVNGLTEKAQRRRREAPRNSIIFTTTAHVQSWSKRSKVVILHLRACANPHGGVRQIELSAALEEAESFAKRGKMAVKVCIQQNSAASFGKIF